VRSGAIGATRLPTLSGQVSDAMSETTSAVAMIDEGNALEEEGRINEAMARYDAAVRADPQCARAHLNRATSCSRAPSSMRRGTRTNLR